jgi:formylglycine-generating enzyme required for sulfatase activity
MAGNVWEWVADYFAFSYYYTYPVNGWPANPAGPAYSDMRAIRSGAWDILRRGNRASRREGGLPYDLDTSTGFRCARTP